MHSNGSIQTPFDSQKTLFNHAIDTPDKLLDSEPSPTNFSEPPFVPTTPSTRVVLPTFSSSNSDTLHVFPSFQYCSRYPQPHD